MGFNRAGKAAQYWRIITLLLVLVAVLLSAALGIPGLSNSLLFAALPLAFIALWLVRYHRNELESWQVEMEKQLPIDIATGATTQIWFKAMLEQECRRAVREFSPMTVVKLIPFDREKSLHNPEYIQMLQERMSRPGDLIGIDASGGLILLMPATNETVVRFAQRIFQLFNDHHLAIHLLGYTFNPVADLNGAKVSDILSQLQDNLEGHRGPEFKMESEGFDMPSVTYSI